MTNFFLYLFKNKIFFNAVKFEATPSSFVAVVGSGVRDPGSGMDKSQDPRCGINIPDPQHLWKFTIFGGIDSLESIPGLLNLKLKIRALSPVLFRR